MGEALLVLCTGRRLLFCLLFQNNAAAAAFLALAYVLAAALSAAGPSAHTQCVPMLKRDTATPTHA